MEHCLLFLIIIFYIYSLFSLYQDPDSKEIVPYLLPMRFQPTQTKQPLMTTKSMDESTWAEDMGQFLYYLDSMIKKYQENLKNYD